MVRMNALTDSVDVYNVTDGAADRYGDATDTVGAPTTMRAYVEPLDATEDENDRDTFVSRFKIILPPDAVISGTSLIKRTGSSTTWEVLGQPTHWIARGRPHHIELTAREIDG